MNSVTIIGNITKKPELRTTSAGVNVCGFTVAVNRPKTPNNQEPGADFFNVSAWRGLGETCAKYLDKGSKVCVVGPVSVRTWESDGKHGATLEVKAEGVEFLSSRPQAQAEQTTFPEQPHGQPQTDQQTGFAVAETDELPF